MDQESIWNLIAKKLSGDATESELDELHNELRRNPDLHYSLQTIYDLWESNPVFPASFAKKAFERQADPARAGSPDFRPAARRR